MTETKPLFPKPLSQWMEENRWVFERSIQVLGEARKENGNQVSPLTNILYVDSFGLIDAVKQYEKYVDDHFKL